MPWNSSVVEVVLQFPHSEFQRRLVDAEAVTFSDEGLDLVGR